MAAAPILKAQGDAFTGSQYARIDGGEAQRRLTRDFSKYNLPQLQSSIGATGQWYSSARKQKEEQAGEQFLEGSYDIQSGMQRQMDDMTRQRMYAALGIVM